MIIPVLPELVKNFLHGDTVRAAEMMGLFSTLFALMQFVFSPVLGTLSDAVGRRPVILISNLGLGLDYILMAVAPSIGWLMVGRIIAGISAASVTTASAYIADVTPPEKRAAGFGLLGAAFGIGFVVGPALGGLLGSMSPRLPFWVAAGLSLANATYGFFVLPESLAKESRTPFLWKKANPIASLLLLKSYPSTLGLSAVNFLANSSHYVLPSTFVLYAGYRFGWGTREVGLTLAAVGICSAIVQAGLAGRITRAIGERQTLIWGLVAGAVGFGVYGAAPSGMLFIIGIPVMALWGLAGPAVQSLMSREVSPSDQGKLQGAQSSLIGLTGVIGPQIFAAAFAAGIAPGGWHVPGAAFYLAALVMVVATMLAAWVTRKKSEARVVLS